jgi:transcriptional regulator with PAS, ATPase and Fis domain
VLDRLLAYDWPGNVRELENAIERAVILAENQPAVRVEDLPPEIRGISKVTSMLEDETALTLAEVEKQHILHTLERLGDNRRATARALGIGENTLWRKLKSYGLVRQRQPRND